MSGWCVSRWVPSIEWASAYHRHLIDFWDMTRLYLAKGASKWFPLDDLERGDVYGRGLGQVRVFDREVDAIAWCLANDHDAPHPVKYGDVARHVKFMQAGLK